LAKARQADALKELLEAKEKGRAECIELACKSGEAAGLGRSEVDALRTRFQQLCLARLEEACRSAEGAGVPCAVVSEARAQARGLRLEARRLQLASELFEARRGGSAASIREACRRAEGAGLSSADVTALRRKLAGLYATCIEETCRRAEAAGVGAADVDEARREAADLRASVEPIASATGSWFGISFGISAL